MGMTFLVSRAFGLGILANMHLNLWATLSNGLIDGLIVGLVVGAIIIPIVQTPDALGRALLFGLLLGLGMAVYQLVQVSTVTGASMGSILNSLDGPSSAVVGGMILRGMIWTLYAVLAGAVVGVLITVPDQALKGALIGIVVGALAGMAFRWILGAVGLNLNPIYIRLLLGVLVWGLITAVFGR